MAVLGKSRRLQRSTGIQTDFSTSQPTQSSAFWAPKSSTTHSTGSKPPCDHEHPVGIAAAGIVALALVGTFINTVAAIVAIVGIRLLPTSMLCGDTGQLAVGVIDVCSFGTVTAAPFVAEQCAIRHRDLINTHPSPNPAPQGTLPAGQDYITREELAEILAQVRHRDGLGDDDPISPPSLSTATTTATLTITETTTVQKHHVHVTKHVTEHSGLGISTDLPGPTVVVTWPSGNRGGGEVKLLNAGAAQIPEETYYAVIKDIMDTLGMPEEMYHVVLGEMKAILEKRRSAELGENGHVAPSGEKPE